MARRKNHLTAAKLFCLLAIIVLMMSPLPVDGQATNQTARLLEPCEYPADAGDTRDAASELATPALCEGALGGDDEGDWFAILHSSADNGAPGDLRLVTTLRPAAGLKAELCVYRGDFAVKCTEADSVTPGAITTFVRPQFVQHYVTVRGLDGVGEYTLSAALSAWTEKLACVVPGARGPANDCFDHARELASPSVVEQKMDGTTVEPDEPTCDGHAIDRSVWYRFTPRETARQWVFADGRAHQLSLYTGKSLGELNQIICTQGHSVPPIDWIAEAETTYHIQVGVSGTPENFVLHLSNRADLCHAVDGALGAVPNNCFSDAIALTSPSTDRHNTYGATFQPWDPWDNSYGYGAVWFAYTPTDLGYYRVGTEMSDYSTAVNIYTGNDLKNLSKVGSWIPNDVQSQNTVAAQYVIPTAAHWVGHPGETYYIQVIAMQPFLYARVATDTTTPGYGPVPRIDAAGAAAWQPLTGSDPSPTGGELLYNGGELVLSLTGGGVSCDEGPANHCFANAQDVESPPVLIQGSTVGAGIEAGEPLCVGPSVWYRFTPTENSRMTLDLYPPGRQNGGEPRPPSGRFPVTLHVFVGDSVDDLKVVAGHSPNDSRFCYSSNFGPQMWDAQAGETYWIRIDGRRALISDQGDGWNEGPFQLVLVKDNGECIPGDPANDCVLDAQTVRLGDTITGSNVGASRQPLEVLRPPCDNSNGMNEATVWYRYQADENRSVTISTAGSDFNTAIAIYKDGWKRPHVVGCNDYASGVLPYSQLTWNAEAGSSYFFQVGGANWVRVAGHDVRNLDEGSITVTLT